MRKLAIALGVAAAVVFAGGLAWKADAASWELHDTARFGFPATLRRIGLLLSLKQKLHIDSGSARLTMHRYRRAG
jgi:hypothetical protein